MIIKGFEAKGVFGYLDFNIEFNDDKNFLVGGNGSGKTTALKLINALITPSFRELLSTSFEYCSLSLNFNGEDIYIYAYTKDDEVFLGINSCEVLVELPASSNAEIEIFSRREDKFEELLEGLTHKYAFHPVIEAISKINSPVFLGLDRRTDFSSSNNDYFLEREIWLSNKRKDITRTRRLIKGSIGASLMEIEMLVKNTYKRIRDLEVEQSQTLRNQILISSFKYSKFNKEKFVFEHPDERERNKLLERKSEIKNVLFNIIDFDSSINDEVDTFFRNLNDLFDGISSAKENINIELLLNKAQIERMYRIVDIIDEHKSRNDGYYKPIDDFLGTVNIFYEDSNKKLEIDTVGQLIVRRPDGSECTIEGLSSGERQLLVIFAHSFFNHNNIFIIDEPELSLHLGWQEKLAETIFSANPSSQFILATHSPEIIAGNNNKAVGCR
ncbi:MULTISPECIES: AAA family ATPase [unclassified Psychrobacter]|uniref:AAA family ATPase n=1 Tax=unclassified Psychrobacter TaxID=196806 RepID=UPI003F4460CE